jgi:hypothetical protein
MQSNVRRLSTVKNPNDIEGIQDIIASNYFNAAVQNFFLLLIGAVLENQANNGRWVNYRIQIT